MAHELDGIILELRGVKKRQAAYEERFGRRRHKVAITPGNASLKAAHKQLEVFESRTEAQPRFRVWP